VPLHAKSASFKVAAERQGLNVTDFILESACEKAEETLSEQTRFVLNDKQWKCSWKPSTARRE